ncbi:MAG: hypothetical protein JJU31_10630 [Wenzhouxiangella sp.]|nr:hypothetical protein [Wenzhouxiangella sp.]MCH8476477.1 hypothetical protein [Wenzhouxiangella sp.]
MKQPYFRYCKLLSPLLLVALLAGCVDFTGPSDRSEQPVLKIHDVSALNVERLEHKLNELLGQQEGLLHGQVQLMDDNRLAVNGSPRLQGEIERMLTDLRGVPDTGDQFVNRPFRIQFWVLKMSRNGPQEALPAGLEELIEPIAREFAGFEFAVQDFLESFHSGPVRFHNLQSGAGTSVQLMGVNPTDDGVKVRAQVRARPASAQGIQVSYQVNQRLVPGMPLVLGRAHGGGQGEEATYQVLVARLEWTD